MRDKLYYNRMGAVILDACMAVHRELGPGFLESVYQYALVREFELRGIIVEGQVRVPLWYKGHYTGKDFFIDLLVDGEILLELKATEVMHPVFKAQLITYLRLSGKYLGYLVNFNVPLLRDGFVRLVNRSLQAPG